MATKDYVKRGRAPKATVTQKKMKTASQPKKRWGSKILIIVIALVAATAYGIHHHKQATTLKTEQTQTTTHTDKDATKTTTDNTAQTIKPVASTATTTSEKTETPKVKKEKALPPLPEEQWDYIKQLETKVIPVKEKKQYDLPSQPFLMQCGAYRSRTQAERRQAQIALAGFESQIRVSKQKSTWYRVILGPYPRRRLAGQARAQMHLHGIEGCAVWQWDL